MLQTALSIVLLAHTTACGSFVPADAPVSSLRKVIVEPESANVVGVLSVDDRVLCRIPCTALLREETSVVVDLTAPAQEHIALPTIPTSPASDPVRIVVHPTRGHPTAGRALVVAGAVWASLLSLLAAGVAADQSIASNAGKSDGVNVAPLFGLASCGLFFIGIGVLFLMNSETSHAAVLVAKPATTGVRITPRGLDVRF